ncbi:MAG: hypothetical protein HC849_24635 [Oscillatoriales cyanobacterium RU_3_3]|nr:hypothetical protein [Oscillatoriales cyanobacterium RU_3_3]
MSYIFFIDRCLGKKVAESLRNARALVEIHDDSFSQDLPDEDWLRIVGDRDWIVLTKDKNIARRSLELLAVAQGNVRLLHLWTVMFLELK